MWHRLNLQVWESPIMTSASPFGKVFCLFMRVHIMNKVIQSQAYAVIVYICFYYFMIYMKS